MTTAKLIHDRAERQRLKYARGQAKMARSMPAKKEIDQTNYSGRVAARLRELRTKKGWTIDDLRERLNRAVTADRRIVNSTLHGWDNGSRKIDPDYYPAIAEVFGISVR